MPHRQDLLGLLLLLPVVSASSSCFVSCQSRNSPSIVPQATKEPVVPLLALSDDPPSSKSQRDISVDSQRSGVLAHCGAWQALVDDRRGMLYYYNTKTKVSTWNRPEEFPYIRMSTAKRVALQEQNRRYLEWRKDVAKVNVLGKGTMVARTGTWDSSSQQTLPWQDTPTGRNDGQGLKQHQQRHRQKLTVDNGDSNTNYSHTNSLCIVKEGDWAAYLDERSGLVYYHHSPSGKSVWDPPNPAFSTLVLDTALLRDLATAAGEFTLAETLETNQADRMRKDDGTLLSRNETFQTRNSIDYDAPARIAYQTSGFHGEFDVFKEQYLIDTAVMVAKKHKRRLAKLTNMGDEIKKNQARIQFLNDDPSIQSFVDYDAAQAQSTSQLTSKFNGPKKKQETPFFFLEITNEITVSDNTVKVSPAMDEMTVNLEGDDSTIPSKRYSEVARVKDPVAFQHKVIPMISPSSMSRTHYDTLQCHPTSSRSDIKRCYLSLAKEFHPDAKNNISKNENNSNEERFVEIAHAWKVLSDPVSRRRYDRELKAKGLSRSAGSLFGNWVTGAAKAMDVALARAESELESKGLGMKP